MQESDDRSRQDAYFSNWLALVVLTLVASLALLTPIALLAKLGLGLALGAAANLFGVATFELYGEARRGLGGFTAMAVYYILANLLQLMGILVAAALGWRSPALFLTIYGLSSIAALSLMERFAPIALKVVWGSVSWQGVAAIAGFVYPLLFQTAFYGVWSVADILLIERLLGPAPAGNYAVAKTLSILVGIAPLAIGIAAGPRIVRLPETVLPWYVLRLAGITAAAAAPPAVILVMFREPLVRLVFGAKYPNATAPLAMLVVGMALYGIFHLLANVWIGLGHRSMIAIASAVGMLGTIATGLLLIPRLGLFGGATALTVGSAAQLAVAGSFTIRAFRSGRMHQVAQRRDRRLL
jgi:O-antigen/teichoic acid export membrane protein